MTLLCLVPVKPAVLMMTGPRTPPVPRWESTSSSENETFWTGLLNVIVTVCEVLSTLFRS